MLQDRNTPFNSVRFCTLYKHCAQNETSAPNVTESMSFPPFVLQCLLDRSDLLCEGSYVGEADGEAPTPLLLLLLPVEAMVR